MTHVSLNGHRTWTTIGPRRGPVVVLLHGGMSSSASMLRSIGPRLAKDFTVAAFDRRGHGRTADTAEPFSYDDMTDETMAFIRYIGRPVHLIGHSDGGIIALLTAMRAPELVRRVVAVGANFHFSAIVETAPFDLDGEQFEAWATDYAALSPDGRGHARVVAQKALTLFATEPVMEASELAAVRVPVLVMAGDDEVIALSHTCALYEALPDAQLAIVPGTSHAVLKERPKESARIIRHFLRAPLPPVTFQPVRRLSGREDGLPSVI